MNNISNYIEESDHEFIKMMAYMADGGLKGYTYEEYLNFAKLSGYITSEEFKLLKPNFDVASLPKELQEKVYLLNSFEKDLRSKGGGAPGKITLSPEQLYNIIDFIELKQAKLNSKEAKRNANISLIISILALLASIIIGIYQLNGTVKLEEKQFNEIVRNNLIKN